MMDQVSQIQPYEVVRELANIFRRHILGELTPSDVLRMLWPEKASLPASKAPRRLLESHECFGYSSNFRLCNQSRLEEGLEFLPFGRTWNITTLALKLLAYMI
jgi:hypothetical protein